MTLGGRATLVQVPKDALISYEPADPDGLVRASLDGELDLDCADQVRDDLAAAARLPGCRHLEVDVSGLTFIDSYALGALVSARNSAVGAGVALTLANPSPPVRKAIQVTGLGEMFGLSTAG
jgi:stage II sporulation protein AA (anti-sigma F factor antagonist)